MTQVSRFSGPQADSSRLRLCIVQLCSHAACALFRPGPGAGFTGAQSVHPSLTQHTFTHNTAHSPLCLATLQRCRRARTEDRGREKSLACRLLTRN